MWAAILFCVLALVSAQAPRPCISPPQFEARFFSFDRRFNFTQEARISYDEINRRVREIEAVQIGADHEAYDILYLHNENREYRLNLRDNKCNVSTVSRPFIPFGIPPDAMTTGFAEIGPVNIPSEHVTVALFNGKTPDGDIYFGSVTYPQCVPVTFGFFSNRTGLFHRTFDDLTLGIPDVNVFTPPIQCRT